MTPLMTEVMLLRYFHVERHAERPHPPRHLVAVTVPGDHTPGPGWGRRMLPDAA